MKSLMVGLAWVALIVLCVVADSALAASGKSAGEIGAQLSGQGKAVGKAVKIIIEVLGVGMAGFGLLKLIGSFKSHEPKGMPIAMFVVGALMVAIPLMINSATKTVLDSDADGLNDVGAN
ncbi:MAG: hypothetical protein ABIW82_17050 [Dokdonella sp.]